MKRARKAQHQHGLLLYPWELTVESEVFEAIQECFHIWGRISRVVNQDVSQLETRAGSVLEGFPVVNPRGQQLSRPAGHTVWRLSCQRTSGEHTPDQI